MSPQVIIGVVGNPRPDSRTHAACQAVVDRLAVALAGTVGDEVDLSAFGPRVLDPGDAEVEAAVARVVAADVVVFASPTYKATYSGLLKCFCDRIPTRALAPAAAAGLMLIGSPDHRLAAEFHLVPLLHELGASVPVRGLVIAEAELGELAATAAAFAEEFAAATARR